MKTEYSLIKYRLQGIINVGICFPVLVVNSDGKGQQSSDSEAFVILI